MAAESWIKMGTGLRSHPKVVRMASALKADKLRVVGGLHAVWCVFDEHSADGLLEGYSLSAMDEEIGWKGFSLAMQAIGWLTEMDDGLQAPDYEEHNGASAKRRAADAKRKAAGREEDKTYGGSWTDGGQMSASDADKKQTRVELEKRRNTPLPPKGEGRFPEFWAVWPSTDRKQDRKKCLEKWHRKGLDSVADEILTHVEAMKATRKWLDGFEPAPLTYLNGERWADGVTVESRAENDLYEGAV